jgi:uncharacterized protein (TIGR03083 family)
MGETWVMAASDPWPTIHAERKALAADVDGLSDEQWKTPSLCDGWSVQDVLGHMTATTRLSGPKFFVHLIGSGFRLSAMQDKDIARETEGSPADTMERFRQVISTTTHPPGPADTWLGETIVHSEDIRRALGLSHSYDMAGLTRTADFYKKSNLVIGAKKRIDGLHLRATDTDWSTGTGPEVSGPMAALVVAMTGRKAVLDDLSGEGVDTLRSRS